MYSERKTTHTESDVQTMVFQTYLSPKVSDLHKYSIDDLSWVGIGSGSGTFPRRSDPTQTWAGKGQLDEKHGYVIPGILARQSLTGRTLSQTRPRFEGRHEG